MTAPEKLDLFSFDSDAKPEEDTVSEEQLESVRAEAYEAGREAALADLLTSEERRICELCETLLAEATTVSGQVNQVTDDVAKEALSIAMMAVGKVLPSLVQTNAIEEIEALVKHCLTELRAEPRVAIRLHAQTLEAFKARLEQIAGATGYDGKLVLLADDELSPADCKVLWADGGASRGAEDITSTVSAAVERYLAGDAQPVPTELDPAELDPADPVPAQPDPASGTPPHDAIQPNEPATEMDAAAASAPDVPHEEHELGKTSHG